MALMVNGKKVLGYAIGGNEFYSLDKFKVSVPIMCDFSYYISPYTVSISRDPQNKPLSPGSALTLRYLRDKGEKIKLLVTSHNNYDYTASVLESGTIDLSKPDSNGHFNFNFQGVNNSPTVNAYCYFEPTYGNFTVYSEAFEIYSGTDHGPIYMQILYLD